MILAGQRAVGALVMYLHNPADEMCFSYKRMEEKDVILDRTLFCLFLFPIKEWG